MEPLHQKDVPRYNNTAEEEKFRKYIESLKVPKRKMNPRVEK
jgi:hypothetical protein